MTAEIENLSLDWHTDFDSIRSFHDQEVNEQVKQLLSIPGLKETLGHFLPSANEDSSLNGLLNQASSAHSITEFQECIRDQLLPSLFSTFSEINVSGIEDLDPSTPYLFISNHRDIVLDPLLLLAALDQNGFKHSHSAIGDNLLQHPVSKLLAKLTRCFSVFRSIKSPKAALKAMKVQSSYIRHILFSTQESVWIAQKEGRAKDGIDTTNPALIKMLSLARPKSASLGEYLNKINIVPVCFSYEWDPVDIEKATELEIASTQGSYEKSSLDDVEAVRKGLLGLKGKVTVHFDAAFSKQDISNLNHQEIAQLIDKSISKHYVAYPNMLAAQFILSHENGANMPFEELKLSARSDLIPNVEILASRLEGIDTEIKKRVLSAYAAPLEQKNL